MHYGKVKARKFTTLKGYETIIRVHLLPAWKGKCVGNITRGDVRRLLLEKQKTGLAANTVENIRNSISGMFGQAVEDGVLTANPALRLGKFIKKDDRRKHIRPLTREQVTTFLRCVREHFPLHYALILAAFRTGMRLGELLGLAWADIDFEASAIEVRRSYTHGRWSTPKSQKSRRFVDMSDQLRAILLEHREIIRHRFGGQRPVTRLGDGTLVELVFPSDVGGPLDGENFRHRVFVKTIEKSDIPRFRFHDIRHTFASLLLAQGESLHYVKEQMGHASIQTTVDVYAHLVPGSNRTAVNGLDDPDEPTLKVVPATAG